MGSSGKTGMATGMLKDLNTFDPGSKSFRARPPNPGKGITDDLPGVEIDVEALDMYSQMKPLDDVPFYMWKAGARDIRDGIRVLTRRKMFVEYGLGIAGTVLRVRLLQPYFQHVPPARRAIDDPAVLKEKIREYAESIGYICGFTKVDRRFISRGKDRCFPFDTALVLGWEMDKSVLEQVPHQGRRMFNLEAYVNSGRNVFEVARFVRALGCRCHVRIPFDAAVKYPPHAIMAGMGELGAQGVLITRQFGPRQRLCMISIDADIEPDRPVDLGMADYCDHCRICIRKCPAGAIPEERTWWRGVRKRRIVDVKCFEVFSRLEYCGICYKVCPINRFGYDACMEAYEKDGTILGKEG